MLSQATIRRGFRTTITRSISPLLATCLLAVGHPATLSAQQTVPGFAAHGFTLPKAKKFWSALVMLHGEIIAFDGKDLLRFDADTGRRLGILASLPSAVFGSDLVLGPSGKRLYVGESSNGSLRVYDLVHKTWRQFATLGGNYSMAFHPHEGERFLYVSALPGFKGNAKVFRVDTLSGQTKLIAEAPGFSGPIAFDRHGALYFSPSPKGAQKASILRWSRAQVLTASSGPSLSEKQAQVVASGFNNASDLAFDSEGTLYASDSKFGKPSSLIEIRGGKQFASNVLRDAGQSYTALIFVGDGKPFERFGNGHASLWTLNGNFSSGTNKIQRLSLARPQLDVSNSKPRAQERLIYSAKGLPAGSLAIFLLGSGLIPEAPIGPFGHAGLLFPDFAIIPTAPLIAVIRKANARGEASLSGRTPAASGAQWTTQVLAGPVPPLPGGAASSPWVTSSAQVVRIR